MSLFSWLFTKPILPHPPATRWHVPLDYMGDRFVGHSVTVFHEDLPKRCFKCDAETEFEDLEPMYIEGDLQYMKRACYCPNGCGFTVWIA